MKSEISNLIERSRSSKDFSALENEKFFIDKVPLVDKAPYQLQHFWENSNIDDEYLLSLLKYQNGKLFKSIFELFFLYEGKLSNCNPKIICDKNWYQNILKFLFDNRPDLLIQFIKESQCFLKSPYLKSFSFLEDSSNPDLKKFYRIAYAISKDNEVKLGAVKSLENSIKEEYKEYDILYHFLSILSHSFDENDTDLNFVLESFTRIISNLPRNTNCQSTKRDDGLSKKCSQLLDFTSDYLYFRSNCIYVFCYDSDTSVELGGIDHDRYQFKCNDNILKWRKNGDKYFVQRDHYKYKSFSTVYQKDTVPHPVDIEFLQAKYFIDDIGLSSYDMGGFTIEDAMKFFVVLKSPENFEINPCTIYTKEKLIERFYDLFHKYESKEKISTIIDWFTFEEGYFNFGQKLFIKVGDKLYLPSRLLQEINCYTPLTNYIFNPKNELINKAVSEKQAELLKKAFKNKMPQAEFLVEEEIPKLRNESKTYGEIDLAIYDGQNILIIEIKGAAIRANLKERHNIRVTTLQKANEQLTRLSDKFEDELYYNWLLTSLDADVTINPKVHYITVSTSFEWDDYQFKFPKYALFTLILMLRSNEDFLNISLKDLLELLEKNAVWSPE